MPSAVAVTTPIPTAASLPQAMAATANYAAVPVTPIGFLRALEKGQAAGGIHRYSGHCLGCQRRTAGRWCGTAIAAAAPVRGSRVHTGDARSDHARTAGCHPGHR